MRKFTIYFLLFCILPLFAQEPVWNWSRATSGDKQNIISSIAVDNLGNSYSVGYFYSSTLPFGNVILTNTSPNNCDLFLIKCNKKGDIVWAKSAGGIASETTFSVSLDAAGNVYWAGSFGSPQISFDNITLNNAGPGTSDIFIAKYSANGNVIWAKSFGGNGNDFASSIKVSKNNNFYLYGNYTSSPLIFGAINLINLGADDLFLTKFNLNGDVIWAKRGGGLGSDVASDLAIDKNENNYFVGRFSSKTIDIGGKTLQNDSTLTSTFFASKFDKNGNAIWAKSASNENGQYVAVDTIGNAYITGSINGLGSKFGTTVLQNHDQWTYDQYLVKYDPMGNLIWAQSTGGDKNDIVKSIVVDKQNNIIIAGAFNSTSLSIGQSVLTSNGEYDIYMARYAPDGVPNATLKYGGSKTDEVGALAIDGNGDMFLGGMFNSPMVNFGAITAVKSLTDNNLFITSTIHPDNGPIVGCMDTKAKNYNPLATMPAQCIYDSTTTNPIYGCMDSKAKNYNPLATMPAQCIYDSTANPIYGCKDPMAKNYNPLATMPAQCIYDSTANPIYGCKDPKAKNYNPLATMPAQCIYDSTTTNPIYGCKDPKAKNYNPLATMPAQCVYDSTANPIYGCMDSKAKNYNPLATMPAQCVYDSTANPIYGCMDSKAKNYNPLATAPAQCIYDSTANPIYGCKDPKAKNYNPLATMPAQCIYDSTTTTPTPLTYKVSVPAGTVECYFAGMINNWTQQKMTKTGNLQYEITFPNATKWQEYKYCSGPSWAFGETTNGGKNRTWTESDLVTGWTNVFNPNATGTDVTYTVTVPMGTNTCYFAGAANNWQFAQMTKVGDRVFKFTINTPYRDKYKYLSGPDWKYCELDTAYKSTTDRNYSPADIVARWGLVYNPNGADEIIGCTNPKALNFNKFATKEDGSCRFPITTEPIYGCTNPVARNYNSMATIENGSCLFGDSTMIVWGCMNSTASNYNPKAVKDNGTCIFGNQNYIFGCMNPTAKNYNRLANKEDGSCIFVDSAQVIWGCTNPTATNFNPKANKENGTCKFVDSVQVVWGCTNVQAMNYNPKATMENGSCVFAKDPTVIYGCTKQGALNYNPSANKENGSCIFKDSTITVLGCTNAMAKNYNPLATKDNGTCIFQDSTKMILGCTNPTAKNFNRLATHDNGTCVFSDEATKIFGCTKPTAKNYNPLATVENGSCVFADSIKLPIYGCTNKLALNYNPLATVNNGTCKFEEQLIKGCTDKKAKNFNPLARVNDGTCKYDSIKTVYGCTDSLALNYNPLAKIDNKNCVYQTQIPGCMDVLALNYNPYANVKDGSCKYPVKIWGCTDKTALNFNPNATHNDGNCQYTTQIYGCTDPLATNYNPLATKDNRTCVFAPVASLGCTNKQALNFNPNANTDNGTCVFETITDTIVGCMDKAAKNYNPVATKPSGNCVFAGATISGCTSPMALNYNKLATVEDESCIFAKPVNIVLPIDKDALVAVKDTLAKIVEGSCSFDFNTPIDTVYIVSSSIISLNEIQVVWAIKQGTNITNVTSNYTVDKDGKSLLFLSLVCNGGGSKVIATGRYGAPYGGSSVQGVTVSSYYQVPTTPTRLIALNQTKAGVSMYPNPVKDMLLIDYKSNRTENITIWISSLDGKRLLSKQMNALTGQNRYEINTSSLNEGIYMLTIHSNSTLIHVNKLVKN